MAELMLELVTRFVAVLVFVVLNSFLFFYAAKIAKVESTFEKPTIIAAVLGILFLIGSFLTRLQLPYMLIAGFFIPFVFIKEVYKIEWTKAGIMWSIWFAMYAVILFLIALVSVLF